MSELKIADVRESVVRLALVQEEKLRDHDKDRGPRGWIRDDPMALWARILEESEELQRRIAELHLAVTKRNVFESPIPQDVIQGVVRECADVANFAMMIADVAVAVGGNTVKADPPKVEAKDEMPEPPPPPPAPPIRVVKEGKRISEPYEPKAVPLSELEATKAKKLAVEIYTDGEWRKSFDGNSPGGKVAIFDECKARSLLFYGWKVDEKIGCWMQGKRRLTIEAVNDLRPKDAEFAEMFIDKPVIELAMSAWHAIEKMLAEEKRVAE